MNEESPGHRADLAAGFAPGSRLGGYRLEEQVGAGGMAVVFRAHDERLDRLVALKIMTPAMGSDDMFRQRFIRESRAAAAVEDPHIIPVYEAGEAGYVLFIAMRLVRGGDVRSLLRREGPLSPDRVASIMSPVASALDAAHAAGLVHRDVKPANILLDRRPGRPDHVYLSDFGLSKSAEVSLGLTAAGQFLGTPDYTAPEQIEGLPVDGRTDQYALACAVFELLTGQAPFHRSESFAAIWAHLNKPPPSLAERRPGLPPAVDGVIAKALAKAQANRYETCWEFADALRDALGLPPYHLSSASDPGLARPGSLPGRAGTGPSPEAPRAVAFSPAAGASPGQASPAAAAGVSVPPPGEDTEASEIYAARSPGLNWPAGQFSADPELSIPDDQATDPGLQVIRPDPDGAQENEPSAPRQQAGPGAVQAGDEAGPAAGPPGPAEQPAAEQAAAPPAKQPAAPPAEQAAGAQAPPAAPTPTHRAAPAPAPGAARSQEPEAAPTPAPKPARTREPEAAPAAEQPVAPPAEQAAGGQAPQAAPTPTPRAAPAPASERARTQEPEAAPTPTPRATPAPAPGAARTREPEAAPTPAPQPSRTREPEAAPTPALQPPRTPASEVAAPAQGSGAPPWAPARAPDPRPAAKQAGAPPGRNGTPAGKPGAPARPTGSAPREQAPVSPRRPAPPQNWPGSPRSSLPGAPRKRPGTPPKAAGSPPEPPTAPGRMAGEVRHGRRPQRRRAAYLALIGAGILVAAGVAVVLTMVANAHIEVPSTGSRLANPSDYSKAFGPPQAGSLSSLAFSPDGRTLSAGASGDQKTGPQAAGITYLWNTASGNQIQTFSPGGGAEAFSPDGTMLAAAGGSDNTSTYLWRVNPKHRIAVLSDQRVAVAAVAFSANGKKLAVNGADGTVHVWTIPPSRGAMPAAVSPGTVSSDAVAFSPTGLTLAMGGSDGQAYLWNAITGNTRTVPIPGSSPITAVAFSPDGKSLAAGDSGGVTDIWDLATHRSIALTDPDSSGVNSVAFSPDGKWLAAGDANGQTYLWHLPAGKLAETLANPKVGGTGAGAAESGTEVLSVAFDPDGTTLATTDTNGHAYLWKVR